MRQQILRLVAIATVLIASLPLTLGLHATGIDAAGPARPQGALAYAPETATLYRSDGQALYRSDDGADQWIRLPLDLSSSNGRIAALAVSAEDQGTVYVAGPGLGVLKSLDAGGSWAAVDEGLPSREVIALATHSTLTETVYAVLADKGMYRSEDGGASWRMVDKGPEAPVRRIIHVNMEGSMQTGFLFAATEKGVYRAMDCFCGWRIAGNSPEGVTAVAFNPNEPAELYVAAGQQIFRTGNGGEEWQPAGSPGGDVTALAYSRSGVLYALVADDQVVRGSEQGRQWE